MASFASLPHPLILTIFDYYEFPLNRHLFLASNDYDDHSHIDFSAAFRNWETRRAIGYKKMLKLLYGKFKSDSSKTVYFLFTNIIYNTNSAVDAIAQFLTCIRLKHLKSIDYDTPDEIAKFTIAEHFVWNFCPKLEQVSNIRLETKEYFESLVNSKIPLKTLSIIDHDCSKSDNENRKDTLLYGNNFSKLFSTFSATLSRLTLDNFGIDDSKVEILVKHMVNLKLINFANNFISKKGVSDLVKAYTHSLKELCLYENPGTKFLASCYLELASNTVTALEHLYLMDEGGWADSTPNSFFKDFNTCLFTRKMFPKLKRFEFSIPENETEFNYIAQFLEENKQIYHIGLVAADLKCAAQLFKHAEKMSVIESLTIVTGDNDLPLHLSKLISLKSLKIESRFRFLLLSELNQITDLEIEVPEDAKSVFKILCGEHTGLNSLQRITMKQFTPDTICFKHLDKIEKLRPNLEISMSGWDIDSSAFKALLKCKNIVDIEVEHDMGSLEQVKEAKHLKTLKVKIDGFNDADFSALSEAKSLENIEITFEGCEPSLLNDFLQNSSAANVIVRNFE